MKVLVIGSEGFIGSHCVAHFLQHNHQVIGCDLLNKKTAYEYFQISRFTPDYESIFEVHKFDICINAAGNGSVPVSIEKPLLDFEANVYDTFRLLEQIRLKQPFCKFVYFSSAAVYGNPILPVKESNEINPISPYGWHKYHAEQICKEYHILYGIPILIFRPFSVFGPGLRKQIIWDLFSKFKSVSNIEVFGTGKESRDFIYIKDLIGALDHVLNYHPVKYDVFNVASGRETSISELVASLSTYFDNNKAYFFNGILREGDPKNWVADISKLESIGYKTVFSLESGLNETIEWLRNQI